MRRLEVFRWRTLLLALTALLHGGTCLAWGNDGHATVALIAEHYLTPATRQRVAAVLAGGSAEPMAGADLGEAAGWADRYRDSDRNTTRLRYRQTYRWHFVNLDLRRPDLQQACFGHPPLRREQPAARGPAQACIVDKIAQFRAEWLAPDTPPAERLLALRFLLHFVADLHQPLHASDNDDQGGNQLKISGPGNLKGSLHRFWDSGVVRRLGRDPERLAQRLRGSISAEQRQQWQRGTPADWALESHALAVNTVYGKLPPPSPTSSGGDKGAHYRLPQSYIDAAEPVAARQLSKAGVRLALLLEPVRAENPAALQKLQFH
jgi:hypothetical protein